MRIAVINRKKCFPSRCSLECIKACPVNRKGQECIFLAEEKKLARIDEDLCTGCGICQNVCPLGAIHIVNLASERGQLTHQYGPNTFRLFGLPIPKEGRVTGILGRNGIGKTTALKILAGLIKPNLGDYENEVDWEEVIRRFRGSEIQNYLTLLSTDKIKASYKPQQVDRIPEFFKENITVEELLSKISSHFGEYVKRLDLGEILDSELKSLSGGELQRVAICACLLKESDIYLLDEPSSFLDVKQRLKVAKFIRELSEKGGKRIVVVEHDLATLDFLSDIVHAIYGVPGVYGVISQPYTVKEGINHFLQGYLPDYNVRIRDKAVTFVRGKETSSKKGEVLLEYPELSKKFKAFSLSVSPGKIYKKKVTGIFGENALGKTTFAKMLAGVLKPDNTELKELVKISYKPQYIFTEYTKTVRELLSSVADIYTQEYKTNILDVFELEPLLDHKVKELSGGELQRVIIALCLSRKADVYLLDEPTAYLDIEMRIKLAKELRNFTEREETVLVVIDHDLLLLDYVCDNAIVFEGIPAREGRAKSPQNLKEGMNHFLSSLEITFRRDPSTGRPRANKTESQKDREQKKKGEYYA